MDDFDFNASQNGNNPGFQGNQHIILEDSNAEHNSKNNKNFDKDLINEKPSSFGEINLPQVICCSTKND